MLEHRERHLIKGYGTDDRIVYGTGRVVDVGDLASAAAQILRDERVSYVHVRSETYNCFTCRIDAA